MLQVTADGAQVNLEWIGGDTQQKGSKALKEG